MREQDIIVIALLNQVLQKSIRNVARGATFAVTWCSLLSWI